MKSGKWKIALWAGGSVAALVLAAIVAGAWYLHHYIPAEIMPDIRAAIAARKTANPDARLKKYLEGRYGSLDDPANRRRAFEGFFDPAHIRAMQLIVKHSPPDQRGENIQATANWIANYRQTMTPEEKTALANYYQSAAGQNDLRAATAQYMNQDVVYRNSTVPVITELMTTLNSLRK